jgi:Ca2+-binding EF-hand superfamily protein
LISGLSTTEQELEKLQKEFLRLDKDKKGILNKQVLE